MTPSQKLSPQKNIVSKDLEYAEKIALAFNSAFKYYSLYPGDHPFSQNYLVRLQADLDEFLQTHKSLRLDIEKNSFFYHGESVYKGTADDSNSAYLLTRDRIQFLEFLRNIKPQEITAFFDILNKHRNPTEEIDGDIATSLWHISLNNINYEAADIFAMEAIDFDLSMFKAAPGVSGSGGAGTETIKDGDDESGTDHDPETGAAGFGDHDDSGQDYSDLPESTSSASERLDHSSPGLLLVAKENDLAELTYEEKLTLESYLLKEEGRNVASDTIDILLIILSIESNQLEFATILDFLEFEFFDAIDGEDYNLAHKISNNINNISRALSAKKPWAVSLINIFFAALAKEERFAQLPLITDNDHFSPDPDQLEIFLSTLTLLPPEIMFTLATLAELTLPDNLRQRNEILEIIERKANKEPGIFLNLIKKSTEETCLFLLPIAEGLKDNEAVPIYYQMTHHQSVTIRRTGMDGLFHRKHTADPEQLVHLLNDKDEQIRQRILSYLESSDCRLAEATIVEFLKSNNKQDDHLHLLECYKILGQCLSNRSLQFLRGVLLESKLSSVLSKMNMTHKKGAAYALRSSGKKEAMEILRTGADSIRPDVRHVCQKALGQS